MNRPYPAHPVYPLPFTVHAFMTAELGYRMPAEWELHRGTWLSWPHKEASWPGKFAPVPAIFARMVRLLADREEVHINVAGPAMEAGGPGGFWPIAAPTPATCFFHFHPTNDAWCRDHGPIFVQRPDPERPQAIVDWGFNAWGGKYPPYDLDDVIPTRIAEELSLPVFHPGIVLEGGSIDVNGRGTLLTTESCLLNPNRNPELTRPEIEQFLRAYLGVRTSSGWATVLSATTPMATSTILPDSLTTGPSSLLSRTIRPTKTTSRFRRTWSGFRT